MAINGVTTTPLSIIDTKGGAVLHAMKRSDHGFSGFGIGRDNSISCEVKVYDRVYNCARLAITFSDDLQNTSHQFSEYYSIDDPSGHDSNYLVHYGKFN